MFNVLNIRKDFPILDRKINGHNLIYFDNGATSQKPIQVLESMNNYYINNNANINRGVHTLSEESTEMYQDARKTVASFINAERAEEIIFVRNSTEAINLVAFSWGRKNIIKGDELIISMMEHHSNLIPWQVLAKEKNAKLNFIPFNDNGELDYSYIEKNITSKTKILSLVHVSNALGTINNIEKVVNIVRGKNPKTIIHIDGSQSVPHFPIDVRKNKCDFLSFTGHKMLGPMGIGVLYGKEKLLNNMPPFLTGGDMIKEVYLDHFACNELPEKFEAGTPNVCGAIGLARAIIYLKNIGMENIRKHDMILTKYCLDELNKIKGIKIYGPPDANKRGGLISFNIDNIHPHDAAHIFNQYGICVRSGHHCTMPLHQRLNIVASLRASFYLYNTTEEIDKFIKTIHIIKKTFNSN